MKDKVKMEKFDLETEEHLARYLVNKEKRTGQKWVAVERYNTGGATGMGRLGQGAHQSRRWQHIAHLSRGVALAARPKGPSA